MASFQIFNLLNSCFKIPKIVKENIKKQVAMIYFWTSITKLHSIWLKGTILSSMVGPHFAEIVSFFSSITSWNPQIFWMLMAVGTLVLELCLAIGFWFDRGHFALSFAGIGMHFVMHISGLRIGLFSYIMISFYLFHLPPSLTLWIGKTILSFSRKANSLLVGPSAVIPKTLILMIATMIPLIYFSTILPIPFIQLFTFLIFAISLLWLLMAFPLAPLFALISSIIFLQTNHSIKLMYFQMAHNAMHSGDLDSAAFVYESKILYLVDPKDVDAWNQLGLVYDMRGDSKLALEKYAYVIDHLDPVSLQAHSGKFTIQEKIGEYQSIDQLCGDFRKLAYLAEPVSYQFCNSLECEKEKRFASQFVLGQLSNYVVRKYGC